MKVIGLVSLSALLGVAVQPAEAVTSVQCLNESGDKVSWWFIYKLPNGLNYVYKDSTDSTSTFKLQSGLAPAAATWDSFEPQVMYSNSSHTDVTASTSPLTKTLGQLFATGYDTLAYASYNDEKSAQGDDTGDDKTLDEEQLGQTTGGAHSKGVIATGSTAGFWLVHSVPAFPELSFTTFDWGAASTTYGQSFLCLSLDAAGVETAAKQLQFIHPDFDYSNLPPALESKFPLLFGLINGKRMDGYNIAKLTSQSTLAGSLVFTSFAKDNLWGKDLYDDLVSPTFKQSFLWETWRRSPALPTVCCSADVPYDSVNVATVDLGVGAPGQFKYTQDHAKLGVALLPTAADLKRCSGLTSSGNQPWVCVGGINRMSSQRSRGGGTVCVSHKPLWTALSGAFEADTQCSK